MEAVAVNKKLPAGAVMMNPGDVIQYIPIVLKGSLRILLQNENGDERFLYHIYPDETCALSLSCCQAHKLSEIKAVAEEDTQVMMVPVRYLDEWMKYPEWKKYVSDTQAQRFTELLETIERVAFSKLDEQLWSYLVKRVQATGNPVLKITHQQIANELNSPREVITRLLHQLASQKRVTLARNLVEVHVLK
ncbi:MAG TPA: Crp/Fnr family transcriptional regulator [Chitinophagales bacterium]|nr:Crp/Fnr family transcriptional regulator [Chitinophagales bacterium]